MKEESSVREKLAELEGKRAQEWETARASKYLFTRERSEREALRLDGQVDALKWVLAQVTYGTRN